MIERKITRQENEVLANRNLYVFNKKTGKVVKRVDGLGKGMLGMWALQNISKSRIGILVFEEDNMIERVYIGNENVPKIIHYDKHPEYYVTLDDYIIDEEHVDINGLITIGNFIERG